MERRQSTLSQWGIQVDEEGLRVIGANGEKSDVVSEVSEGIVKDASGQEFVVEGGAEESLSKSGTPKKLLNQFSKGFPASWSRVTNQERRRLRQIQDLKEVEWRDLPFVGIEFTAIESIYADNFAFPHLIREMQEGVLANDKHPIYLFQGAQPCWSDKEQTMRNVPYIVAIDCDVPPPNKLVYHTLQLAKHDVIDMRSQPSYARYEWTPYIPKRMQQENGLEKLMVPVHILGWAGRGAQFQNMKEADVHKIEFLHPYVLLPQVVENLEKPVVTCVDFEWEHLGKKYQIVFDKEIDRLATFIPEFIEDNDVPADQTEQPLKDALIKAFREKREKEEAGFNKMGEDIAALSEADQQALRNMKTYKFYPHHPELPVTAFVDDNINPYFGKATKVMLPTAEDKAELEAMYELERKAEEEAITPRKRSVKRERPQEEPTAASVDSAAAAAPQVEAEAEEVKKVKLDEENKE